MEKRILANITKWASCTIKDHVHTFLLLTVDRVVVLIVPRRFPKWDISSTKLQQASNVLLDVENDRFHFSLDSIEAIIEKQRL